MLRREPLGVVDAVTRIAAVQAQEPASPYLALWSRVTVFDPAALDTAFADGSIVKSTLMRVTLHAVAADDHPPLHAAMQTTLRAARLNDRRFKGTGLSPADADALVPELQHLLSAARSNGEVEAWLEARLGSSHQFVWWALRQCGPFVHAPTGGPWSFGPRPSYTAARGPRFEGDRAAAVAVLVRRYLEAFGPATVQDIAQFGMLYMPLIREGVAALGDEVTRFEGPGGAELLDLRGMTLPHEDSPAPPRLLPMWDSSLLAYRDRSRILPEPYRRIVIQGNGDVLPTLLVDGHVAGVWRPVEGGIEATAFHALDAAAWSGLDAEGRGLVAFLEPRDPSVYRRYARWWSGLPAAEVRILGRADRTPL